MMLNKLAARNAAIPFWLYFDAHSRRASELGRSAKV
jgi:hypothetical protein